MASTAQSIIVPAVRTVPASTGGIVPVTVTADYLNASPDNISIVRAAFDVANDFRVSYHTFRAVLEAVRHGGAIVVLYADAKAELLARALWPESVSLTKANDICCKAFCTMRQEWRTFRLDRFVTCHAFITPDDLPTA